MPTMVVHAGMASTAGLVSGPTDLFRVGQTRGRRRRQPAAARLFGIGEPSEYSFEPGLPKALAALTQRQRLAVVLVHGYGYTLREVAGLTGIRPTTVRNHLSRGLSRLRALPQVSS